MTKNIFRTCLFSICIVLLCAEAWALVLSEDGESLDFRINVPGARANAMGGAFIGLADDATAAYTNPAGLTILTQPEISFEYKCGEYTLRRYTPENTHFDFDNTASGVSFLSYVNPKDKITFAIYRHQLINLETDRYDVFMARDEMFPEDPDLFVESSLSSEIDIDAITYGFGAGFKLTEKFSVGVSVGFAQLDYNYQRFEYQNPDWRGDEKEGEFVAEEDSAEHFTVAMLWNIFGELNLGMVYRYGPEFDTTRHNYHNLGNHHHRIKNVLKVPDMYGFGLSYRFFSSLTTVLDVNYVKHSQFLDDLRDWDGGRPKIQLDKDDTYEINFGLEYVFDVQDKPIAARFGYHFKPQTNLFYKGGAKDDWMDEEFKKVIRKGEDDHIYSLGFGIVPTENMQFDFAISAGDFIVEGILSFVYRFDK